ncbi:MAG: hypothetical protein PUE12_02950 [Oscillospiraceae bacterium]|nr:hypothetical protein [Oscillospiraceae bacterium]
MNYELAKTALGLIANRPSVLTNFLDDLDMPNLNLKTMGGDLWWRDLVEAEGWRIQQNSVTKHCRILDPNDVRRAWGGEDAMMKLFRKIV